MLPYNGVSPGLLVLCVLRLLAAGLRLLQCCQMLFPRAPLLVFTIVSWVLTWPANYSTLIMLITLAG